MSHTNAANTALGRLSLSSIKGKLCPVYVVQSHFLEVDLVSLKVSRVDRYHLIRHSGQFTFHIPTRHPFKWHNLNLRRLSGGPERFKAHLA